MKQLIICENGPYAEVTYTEFTTAPDASLGLFDINSGKVITKAEDLKNNVTLVARRGAKAPYHFPEIDVKSLTVTKAVYKAGKRFEDWIKVPTPVEGKVYTLTIIKKGTKFNERSNWTVSAIAKTNNIYDLVDALNTQLVAIKDNAGLNIYKSLEPGDGGSAKAFKFEALDKNQNYELKSSDDWTVLEHITTDNPYKEFPIYAEPEILGKEYVKDLASRCAAGKGFNYLGEDGKELYPGYPEVVKADQYVMYTLRFAVPRASAKQRDEVVYQTLHIAIPVGSDAITKLDAIFGISGASAAAASVDEGDETGV